MGHLEFESLSQANYKKMTLISEVSLIEMMVWNKREMLVMEQIWQYATGLIWI